VRRREFKTTKMTPVLRRTLAAMADALVEIAERELGLATTIPARTDWLIVLRDGEVGARAPATWPAKERVARGGPRRLDENVRHLPAENLGKAATYRLRTGSVVLRPIAWIPTQDRRGS
jgi:hypothetical protein